MASASALPWLPGDKPSGRKPSVKSGSLMTVSMNRMTAHIKTKRHSWQEWRPHGSDLISAPCGPKLEGSNYTQATPGRFYLPQ